MLPWVRTGAAAAIGVDDVAGAPMRAAVNVQVRVSVNGADAPGLVARLRGPGDVTGIAASQIIRQEPPAGSDDFEPNQFCAIEFDRPDFPWLFTPARAKADAKLRPWLALVVVKLSNQVTLVSGSASALPALRIVGKDAIRAELPDLSKSWAWAHAQAASPAQTAPATTALEGNPAYALSRLVCPRMLEASTDYVACVVPAFEVGRRAGLGTPLSDADLGTVGLSPAWSAEIDDVLLPVYCHWTFRAGVGGDFKSLAQKLVAQPAPEGLGRRSISVAHPGFGLGTGFPAAAVLGLDGALMPFGSSPTPWPAGGDAVFESALAPIINESGEAALLAPGSDPLLAPPIYGEWHVGRATVNAGATPWLDTLNLDPRTRVTAAMGTRIVQEHQEALMAAAWAQAAELQRANQRVFQFQLGIAVGESLHQRHFARLAPQAAFALSAPAFARIGAGAGTATMFAHVESSAMPSAAVAPAMRRIGRDRAPVRRRAIALGSATADRANWVNVLSNGLEISQPVPTMATTRGVLGLLGSSVHLSTFSQMSSDTLLAVPGRPAFAVAAEGASVEVAATSSASPAADSPAAAAFRAAAAAHMARIRPERPMILIFQPPRLEIGDLHTTLLNEISPRPALIAFANAVIMTGNNATAPTTPSPTTTSAGSVGVDQVMASPHFATPMFAELAALSQQWLLPGIEKINPESVIGLATNQTFVESFLVGLNVEMGRELLWRGYPTDQRGTCFDRFWNNRDPSAADITPISQWGETALGSHAPLGGGGRFVVVIRSTLLRRYPDAMILAAPAHIENGLRRPVVDADIAPAFEGSLDPDIRFFGFDLGTDAVTGSDGGEGYFLIVQEHPTAPRFGLDVGTAPTVGNFAVGGAAPAGAAPDWDHTSAHLAKALKRRPVRVAIHASKFASPDWHGGHG